jgi:23S rRNA (adenine2503-C2)-methyltransferase
MKKPSVYSFTQQDWKIFLAEKGESTQVVPYFIDGLYKDEAIWDRHVSPKLMPILNEGLDFSLPVISEIHESEDGTVKFLVKLNDLLEVETVLIPFHKRFTVCLSTQVGCGMNCSFCYTGTQGLKRNLSSGEIVGQYLVVNSWLKNKYPKALLPSIVFMGQGEPLHNVGEVENAIRVLNDPMIIGVGLRHMTLSTVGYLPGIKRLRDFPKINFALSLHSPFEEERRRLIPLNDKFPLSEVMAALDELTLLPKQFITFEYLLIKNLNMTEQHAEALQELLGHRKAILNLIPFNPFPGSEWKRPDVNEVEQFRQLLVSKKLRVMVRTTKGSDILAACGQLKVNKLARKNGKDG